MSTSLAPPTYDGYASRDSLPVPCQITAQPQPLSHETVHDSSLSIYERLRHFLFINFALNKRSFVLSILSYVADVLLFVALNLYLFSNEPFLYELMPMIPNNNTNVSRNFQMNDADLSINKNGSLKPLINEEENINNSSDRTIVNNKNGAEWIGERAQSLKQSYLTLQIAALLAFFICFVLSYLIKVQFKYHRLALNLYDYDVDTLNGSSSAADRDSLASTATSALSSRRKLTSLLKRLLVKLLTKCAALLLNLFYGYQFATVCFIPLNTSNQQKTKTHSFAVFKHTFICVCAVFRISIIVLRKKNSLRKFKHLARLEQKQKDLLDPTNSKNSHRPYYEYYYSYLIKNSQNACNQLRNHANSQQTFRVLEIADVALLIGSGAAMFQLFNAKSALAAFTLLVPPLLLTVALLRYKALLNAATNLVFLMFALFFCSSSSNPISLTARNTATFICFLTTVCLRSLLSAYYVPLTSLERWNVAFLSTRPSWLRLLTIGLSATLHLLFVIAATVALALTISNLWWTLFIVPLFVILGMVWLSFALMNAVNLTYLMAKISACNRNSLNLLTSESNSMGLLSNSTTNNNVLSNNNKKAHNYISDSIISTNNRNSIHSQSSQKKPPCSNLKVRQWSTRALNWLAYNAAASGHTASALPMQRILADQAVRHLGSISYRISLYSFAQTLLLSIFAFNTNSTMALGLYLCSFGLNLLWLSLLYQFCKSHNGSCIAYALVAPPHLLNSNQTGLLSLDSGGNYTTSSMLSSATRSCYVNSLSTNQSYLTLATNGGSVQSTNASSLLYLPFAVQQAISARCTNILHKLQNFMHFHLIENYGCDFAATGLVKSPYADKLCSFFGARKSNGEPYDTYMLYYCGPTSSQSHSISFLDGAEMTVQEIVSQWKEINCVRKVMKESNTVAKLPETDDTSNNEDTGTETDKEDIQPTNKRHSAAKIIGSTSRLILVIDSEHTAKSLDYIRRELQEANVYVALQTACYKSNPKGPKSTSNNKFASNNVGEEAVMGPGSPQTPFNSGLNSSNTAAYLNFGKFTFDWLKSNLSNSDCFGVANNSNQFYSKSEMDEEQEHLQKLNSDDDDDDEDDDDDDEDSDDMDIEEKAALRRQQKQQQRLHQHQKTSTLGHQQGQGQRSSNEEEGRLYEAHCAFSRHWSDFTCAEYEKAMARDFDQFWSIYYPYRACKPLLTLVNCRLFYVHCSPLKRLLSSLRRIKTRVFPLHEFDTGHGFKLFSS